LSKAQVISGDFIMSLAVFMIVIVLVLNVYTNVSEKVAGADETRNMEAISLFASDALMKTPGYPADWNETSVQVIGLSDGGRLNMSKIRKFVAMDYDTARDLLGFQSYNFNVTFYDTSNNIMLTGVARSPAAYFYVTTDDMAPPINGSGLVWDIFYGGSGLPFAGDARNVYSGQEEDVFNNLSAAADSYRTIIIEDSALTQSDVNISGLQNFVASGGILVLEGDASLLQTGFSMHLSPGAAPSGTCAAQDDLLDCSEGDAVEFAEGTWYAHAAAGDTALKTLVVDAGGHATIAQWNHGLGRVYYITDENGEINGADLSQHLLIAGRRLAFGIQPQNANIISATQRIGIVDGRNQPAKISMVVWK
jgi:hypothetical protein